MHPCWSVPMEAKGEGNIPLKSHEVLRRVTTWSDKDDLFLLEAPGRERVALRGLLFWPPIGAPRFAKKPSPSPACGPKRSGLRGMWAPRRQWHVDYGPEDAHHRTIAQKRFFQRLPSEASLRRESPAITRPAWRDSAILPYPKQPGLQRPFHGGLPSGSVEVGRAGIEPGTFCVPPEVSLRDPRAPGLLTQLFLYLCD